MKNIDPLRHKIRLAFAICTSCVILLCLTIFWINQNSSFIKSIFANSGSIFGWIMATAVGLLNAPQVIKTFQERSVSSLSRLTIALHLVNNGSGLLYGIAIESYPLMVCNVFYFGANIFLVSALIIFAPTR